MKNSIAKRLYDFALEIISLVRALPKEMVAQEIGKQLLRAGTSVTANYEEAKAAFSKEDFAYKISISFKEARETNLWLRLLKDSGIVTDKSIDAILPESVEIRNILGKSVSTVRKRKD